METTQKYIWQNPAWPEFIWNTNNFINILSKARVKQGALLKLISTLDIENEQEAEISFLIEEATTTSAIEGEILNRDAVKSSIAKKLRLATVGVTNRSTDGLIELLLDATKNHSKPLDKNRICGWQAALFPTGFSGIYKITSGDYRKEETMQVVSGYPGKEKIHYEAPPTNIVEEEMNKFIEWWAQSQNKLEGIIRAGIAHLWFVTIHPFEDGNGRLARALTDMALAQDDNQNSRYYSLSSQINKNKDEYYNILEKTQKGTMNIDEWLTWFIATFFEAINSTENNLNNIFQKDKWWHEHHSLNLNERNKKVINKLLDAGPGNFIGGLTNKKYASITGISRQTATRELQYLLEQNILIKNPGEGRNTNYDLNWNIK